MSARIGTYRRDNKELTPVRYSMAAVNARRATVEKNTPCFRIHWHERFEFIRVISGKVHIVCGTETVTVSENEMYLVTPQIPHRAYTTDSPVEYHVLMFDVRSFYNDTELCRKYLSSLFDGRAKLNPLITNPDSIACFDELHAIWQENSLMVTSNIYRMLHLLLEHNLIELKEKNYRDDTVLKIINYIEAHFDEEISIELLSTEFRYSPTHLRRKFKEETGLSPMNYLKIYRLEEAYRLLKMSKRNISEVAIHCGFPDANYFTRCFKAHFGFTPTHLPQYSNKS